MCSPARVVTRFDEPNCPYWIYLVISEFLQEYGPLNDFIQLVWNFGMNVDGRANVTIPFQGAYRDTRNYVLAQSWNSATSKELEDNLHPYLLILRKPLSSIDPQKDELLILKFPEGLAHSEKYVELFFELANEIRKGSDLFQWQHSKHRKQIAGKILSRIGESVSVRPGILGFSIDVKKLLIGMLY